MNDSDGTDLARMSARSEGVWTPAEIERLRALVAGGANTAQLIVALRRSKAAIAGRMYRLGLQIEAAKVPRVKDWLPADDRLLRQMMADGYRCAPIAQALGRTQNAVYHKMGLVRAEMEQKSDAVAIAAGPPATSPAATPVSVRLTVAVASSLYPPEQKSGPREDVSAPAHGLVLAADLSLPGLRRRMRDHLNWLGNPVGFGPHVDAGLVHDHAIGVSIEDVAATLRHRPVDVLARWHAITGPFYVDGPPGRRPALPFDAAGLLVAELVARAEAALRVANAQVAA